jgi:hypothetical protein
MGDGGAGKKMDEGSMRAVIEIPMAKLVLRMKAPVRGQPPMVPEDEKARRGRNKMGEQCRCAIAYLHFPVVAFLGHTEHGNIIAQGHAGSHAFPRPIMW